MKPLLLLDVDGVINCTPTPTMEQMLDHQWRDGDARTMGRTFRIWWHEEAMKALSQLVNEELVEARWLTTWMEDAQAEIAPLVGLPQFSTFSSMKGDPHPTLHWWKLERVKEVQALKPRPFIWIDDQLSSELKEEAQKLYGDRCLLITPASNPGLTLSHLASTREWLSKLEQNS